MWRIAGGKLLYLPGRSVRGSVGELEGWEGLRVGRKVQEGGEIYTHTHTGEGNGNPLRYSSLENPMDRGAWQGTVHRVAEGQTQLKQLSIYTHTYS